ncbi:hypothetical protein [Streptomyces chartreusis]|uniref:hypothetical protein n=1 Tax=Streptomyces chartreusis TaxID=1969 RepID=UPI0033C1C6AF
MPLPPAGATPQELARTTDLLDRKPRAFGSAGTDLSEPNQASVPHQRSTLAGISLTAEPERRARAEEPSA